MKYAISAATGHFGQIAIPELLKNINASDITAIVRNTEKAEKILPAGINIKQADYTDKNDLVEALKGIDKLLFISSVPGGEIPRETQHRNVVEAAKESGINYIAYTSFAKADNAKSALSSDHKATEKMIKESGIKYSFLRNAWYLENEMSYLKAGAAGQDAVYAAGEGKIGFALEREYAVGAAKVMELDNAKDVYEFAGKPVTYAELGQAVKKVTGKSFEFKSVSDDEYRQSMINSGFDEDTADIFVGMQEMMRDNELNVVSTDLPDILGHELTTLPDAVKEILNR
ncbi:SDR family oxidoreductase [Companilactobacillus keshanensis]|uniref:SDR family oxidoreductase n=1 Tax=Companilactobacillus keshanensis TaxID=2486003 RepID=A0ABW4BSA7_9LACO|nr:SDR family oxidoreductase [Companilactobacillus keshanensis]